MHNTLKALEAIINTTNSMKTSTAFFPLLLQFAKLFFKDSQLQKSRKKINKEGEKANKIIEVMKKEALGELKAFEKKIRSYIATHSITNQSVMQCLDTFQDLIKSNDEPNLLVTSLEQALYLLLNDDSSDHSSFIQIFGTINRINDDKFIHRAEAFPKFDAWDKNFSYFIEERESTDWYSLNQIQVFWERYESQHYDNLVEALIKSGVNVDKLQDERYVLNKYARFNNQNPSPLFPSIEKYKNYMLQLYLHAQNVLASTISLPAQTKITDWHYDIAARKFSYASKSTTFHRFKLPEKDKKGRLFDGFPGAVLAIITKDSKTKKKIWKFLRLFKEIAGHNSEKDNDKILQAMSDACKQINAQVLQKCGLRDFLEYDGNSVHINPQYLV